MENETTKSNERTALELLVEIEPYLNEWDFPITLKTRVIDFLQSIYGDVRPCL